MIYAISLSFIQIGKYESALGYISSLLYIENLNKNTWNQFKGEDENSDEVYNHMLADE